MESAMKKIATDDVTKTAVLRELVEWAEHTTMAVAGCAGLNVTQARQAASHVVTMRKLLETTSREEPDDRESRWPEGEGVNDARPL